MMRGYWRDPELTATAIDADGWLHTGDLGRLRPDGNLVLAGRLKEMYIRGGYNVYPTEVEAVLTEHPAIARAAVIGGPDPVLGEIGVAFVVPEAGDTGFGTNPEHPRPRDVAGVVHGPHRRLQGPRPGRGRRRPPGHGRGQSSTRMRSPAGGRTLVAETASAGPGPARRSPMKELVYHRQLLPSLERFHDRPMIIDGDYRSTHAEHVERVLRLAHSLKHELGVQRSDRFAVMTLNAHQYLELYHAAFLGAGVINPLNLRLAPAELEYILRDSGTKVCFVDALFAARRSTRCATAAGLETRRARSATATSPTTWRTRTCSRPARRSSPTSPRRTTPSSSCTPAARPACPRACCSTSGPRC